LHAAQRYNFGVTPLPSVIADHLDEIRQLCGRYHVRRLAVFGSAVKGTFDAERSDVDFVVEFETFKPSHGWHSYFDLKFALQDLLRRPVDLVGLTAVENPYFRRSIDLTQRELYAA
jgi:predicted nucleotidyltransferase